MRFYKLYLTVQILIMEDFKFSVEFWCRTMGNIGKFSKIKIRFNNICLQGYHTAVMAQWLRPQTLNLEVPGSNLLAAAVVPLGKALYPHCLVPRKGLKAIGPIVACQIK